MKKSLIIEIGAVVISAIILVSLVYFKKEKGVADITPCPTDAMMCPDGTSISRSGPDCEFGVCKQDLPVYIHQEEATTTGPLEREVPPTVLTKITKTSSSLFTKIIKTLSNDVSSGIQESEQPTPVQKETQVVPSPITKQENISLNETRYIIKNNNLVDDAGNIIYGFPAQDTIPGMETHLVNAVAVNDVSPVVGAIPVDGQAGKYYLSENSFGDIEKCEFSNKIYILDTLNNTRTLLYEENTLTLSSDDPRACSSEMYLLATDQNKLILKYHTIGTNSVCDSTWSEPEKTWSLDVTKSSEGTKRYYITPELYSQAENFETSCRSQLETTSQ